MVKLLKYMRPFTPLIFLIISLMAAMAVTELYLPIILADMINNGMMTGNTGYIVGKGAFMLVIAIAGSGFSIMGAFISARVAMGFGRDVRNEIFTRVSSYSLSEFDKIGAASLITRTTNDVTQVQTALVMMLRFMVYSPIMCVGGIVMALSVDTGLSMILLVMLPVMLMIIIAVAKYVMPLFKEIQKFVDTLNLILRENLTGVRVIRAFNRQQYEEERFDDANRDLMALAVKVNKIMAFMHPLVLLLMNGTAIAIIWFGGVRISEGDLLLGDMVAFLQYAMLIMFSIIMVTMMFIMIPRAQVSAVRINEALELTNTIPDSGTVVTTVKDGSVEFRNVTFRYSGAEQPALRNISFTAGAGETTAIIGGTGSGKTTLLKLIPRFYDVESGQVLVDGLDVKEQPVETLRKKLSVVSQSQVLFSKTVEENIGYGCETATKEEITEAAKTAQADSFISEMEEGYQSEVARDGANLSGGQRQRLCAARALARKTEIYIFDDSFSALDFKTDAALRSALEKDMAGRTKIIVAQRISTIMDADRIIVLNDGEITGIGTHRELLATCEIYGEIARSQLSEEELL